MVTIIKADSKHRDFIQLVQQLDADLAIRDGDDHAFYDQFNKIDTLKHVVIAYLDQVPVSCGAIKQIDEETMEIKRMYTLPIARGKGVASQVLGALEKWAAELGFAKCILETGKKQPEAIGLYLKNGYRIIPNYGQYIGVANSVCFGKHLHA